MSRTLSELLHDAADDPRRPMPFTPADIVRRGRGYARRRAWAWTSVSAATAVLLVVVVTQLMATWGGRSSFPMPAPAPSTSTAVPPTGSPSPSASAVAPAMSEADRTLLATCQSKGAGPQQFQIDPSSGATTPFGGTSDVVDITGWRVVLRDDDAYGTSAGLTSPDGTQFATCNLVQDASPESTADLRALGTMPPGPLPTSWSDPAKALLVDMPLGWSQICPASPTGKVCPDELFFGVGKAYDGVARVHIEWPDKTTSDLAVTDGLYVARHVEKRVTRPVNPKVRDGQPLPSLYISFYDAAGKLLIRYNHNPPMLIPSTCPTNRGC